MHNTSVLIHPTLHSALRERATLQRRSMNYLVAIAISEKMADDSRREAYWRPHRGGVPQNISVPPDVRALTAGRRGGLTGFVLDALGTYLGVEEPAEEPIAGESPDGPIGRISTFDISNRDIEVVRRAMGLYRKNRTWMLRKIIGDWAAAFRLEHGEEAVFGCGSGCGIQVSAPGEFCGRCLDNINGVIREDPTPATTARHEPRQVRTASRGVTPAEYAGPRCGNCWAAMPEGAVGKVCPKCVVEMAARAAAKVGTAAAPPVTRPAVVMCAVCKVKPDTGGRLCDDCASPDPSTFGHGEAR